MRDFCTSQREIRWQPELFGRWVRSKICDEANINVVISVSVRPFIRVEQIGSHWIDFHENLFRKSVKKGFQISLKSEKNNGQFTGVLISS